eukprot:6209313-Pleurochrysis_carterae.AAC.2
MGERRPYERLAAATISIALASHRKSLSVVWTRASESRFERNCTRVVEYTPSMAMAMAWAMPTVWETDGWAMAKAWENAWRRDRERAAGARGLAARRKRERMGG